MHKRYVLYFVSRVLLIASLCLFVPLAWAIKDNPQSVETNSFAVTILLGIFVAILMRGVLKMTAEDFDKVSAKDGLAIVGLTWVMLSAFGALPLFWSNAVPTYVDALFEITSGFTTTGASVIADVEALPRGILFWRSFTHWLGGMGIIVLYLALLPAIGQNALQLYRAETSRVSPDRFQPQVKETAKILWGIYFLFTVAETALHYLGGMSLFDALCHSFGAIATGGFSTRNMSLAAFTPYHQWVVTIFMFLGGTNFWLHYQALKGNLKEFFESEEFRLYVGILLTCIIFFTIVLARAQITVSPLRDSAFQVVSVMTACGYVSANFDLWPSGLQMILVTLMFIGGCSGSTSGGLKVARVLLSFKAAMLSITQVIFPNAVLPVKFNGEPASNKMVKDILTYFFFFILVFFVGTILLTLTESCDLVTAFSATIALLSNVGPGLAKVGAVQNYGWISLPGKALLTFIMLVGRLEIYSILFLFLPSTWKK